MRCQLQKKMGRMRRTGDTNKNIVLGNREDQDRMEKGLKKGIEQEMQKDCSRIDNSTYFPIYKRIKEGIGR